MGKSKQSILSYMTFGICIAPYHEENRFRQSAEVGGERNLLIRKNRTIRKNQLIRQTQLIRQNQGK